MKTENRRGNRNMPMNLKCVSHQILVESHPIPLHDTEGAENLMWLIGLRLRRVWELTVQSKCDLLYSVIRQMSKMGRQGYLYGDSLIKRNTVNNKTLVESVQLGKSSQKRFKDFY